MNKAISTTAYFLTLAACASESPASRDSNSTTKTEQPCENPAPAPTNTPAPNPTDKPVPAPDRVLRVATEGAYAPFSFCGTPQAPVPCTSPNELKGFDIDVAKEVCKIMEYRCEFVTHAFDTIFDDLAAGNYEAVFSAAGYTADRATKGRYTITYEIPVLNDGAHFFGLKGKSLVYTAAGLAGRKLGAQAGSIHENYLRDNFKNSTIVTFPTQDAQNTALLAGQVDAVLTNRDVMVNFLQANPNVERAPGAPIIYGEGGFLAGNIYAVIANQTPDPLLYAKINNAILKLQLSGFIKERFLFWVK
jgi:polar amino acid transport system substrate-binding protein